MHLIVQHLEAKLLKARSLLNMYINVSVTTRASKNEIIRIGDNTFKVYVTAVPEKGLANKKIIELLSDYLKVSKSLIKIKAGATSREKLFEIA
ncbi:MAG: hypothetical protein UT32_C0026G0012 [Parcubacteria group bacterium GW2011_GWC2_39_14]|nr:MAG: hypothetical protein UT32_C0026G0012 [Parcubacteria group bacterium GW2011_GWC2_39_14]KKR53434.1 MAG: hypothetical protein UT91_C0027G0012 [Parcubacteria group bacterium GW2011_GWA2_40_23]